MTPVSVGNEGRLKRLKLLRRLRRLRWLWRLGDMRELAWTIQTPGVQPCHSRVGVDQGKGCGPVRPYGCHRREISIIEHGTEARLYKYWLERTFDRSTIVKGAPDIVGCWSLVIGCWSLVLAFALASNHLTSEAIEAPLPFACRLPPAYHRLLPAAIHLRHMPDRSTSAATSSATA